ncbi:hypothetical protein TNCV_4560641 [Trichonephila clavipes]|nr:hypothetical protein TNCV_4560641 [Trichonephila clavipes]
MTAADFLPHENPPTWAGSNPQPWVQMASDKPTTPPKLRSVIVYATTKVCRCCHGEKWTQDKILLVMHPETPSG